jgi:multisubunit Na+/H+ antiporter MnhE subunit
MSARNRTGQREADTAGPKRPRWLFLVAGGLIYAGVLLGMWIVQAGTPDIQDLVGGSIAAVISVGAGYLVSQRGAMVPSVRLADLRTLAAVPWQVVSETWQVFALAARKAAGRPVQVGALCTVPVDLGADAGGWPAARREAVLTALMSAAPNTIVIDIDTDAGTALVHRLAGAAESGAADAGAAESGANPAPPR